MTERTWEGRARPSMGSIDLCVSCGAKDTTGIQLAIVERYVSHARYEKVTELCFDCASVVTDGLVTLLSHTRKDAVHSAMMAVHALRATVDAASKGVEAAEEWMEQARRFEMPSEVSPGRPSHSTSTGYLSGGPGTAQIDGALPEPIETISRRATREEDFWAKDARVTTPCDKAADREVELRRGVHDEFALVRAAVDDLEGRVACSPQSALFEKLRTQILFLEERVLEVTRSAVRELHGEAMPLLELIDRARDALDAAAVRPECIPIASAVGNELECALERVMDARRLVTETDTSAPCAVCLAHTGEKCTDVANEPAPHSHRGSTLEHRAARLRAALLPQASRGKYGIR